MFIMTHTQFGYYIHGRSPTGNTDISMQRMTEALLREQNDITAKRGLENGSDHQTFSISISDKLSKQYARVMHPLKEVSCSFYRKGYSKCAEGMAKLCDPFYQKFKSKDQISNLI